MNIFVSYTFESDLERIAADIVSILKREANHEVFFWGDAAPLGNFNDTLKKVIKNCDYFVMFWGNRIGDTQHEEIIFARDFNKLFIPIKSPIFRKPEALTRNFKILSYIEEQTSIILDNNFNINIPECAKKVADDLLKYFNESVHRVKGLPAGYPFQYEKDIISAYISNNGQLDQELVRQGCSPTWPIVKKNSGDVDNPIPEKKVGKYRDWDEDKQKPKDPHVVSAALSDYHHADTNNCLLKLNLAFPEAGPRKHLYYPNGKSRLRIGIVVSGGIAPGINSVISGIVKRHVLYHKNFVEQKKLRTELKIYGYLEGFKSLFASHEGPRTKILFDSTKSKESTDGWLKRRIYNHSTQGGSIIPTSRTPDLLDQDGKSFESIINYLNSRHLDIVYVIGGDGSMKGAHALSNYVLKKDLKVSIVGIPKTMDNDILWVWQSFGFSSSIEWAKGAVGQIGTEVSSNPRLCIVQLFGSDSGFVASHTALASGVCDLVLIPEVPFKSEVVVRYIIEKLEERYEVKDDQGRSPYGVILLAETALPQDSLDARLLDGSGLSEVEKEEVKKYFANNCRVKGQTPDELRSAGLKILSSSIKEALRGRKYWDQFRVLTIEPKQLIRSVPPSTLDIILGERLGSLAVDGAIAGYYDFMISQWLTEFVMVPLDLVVLGRKRIPSHGFLWKSVISTTGQPDDLTAIPEES